MKKLPMLVAVLLSGSAIVLFSAMCPPTRGELQDPQPAALQRALADRFEAVQAMMQMRADLQAAGRAAAVAIDGEFASVEVEAAWSERLAEAAVEAGKKPHEEAYGSHWRRMRRLLEQKETLHEAGRAGVRVLAAMRYHEADARVLLERGAKK